jgi:hypothetical protein
MSTNPQPSSNTSPHCSHQTTPPFIPISGLSNFRDVGGWPIVPSSKSLTTTPQHVRRHFLYRGSDPNRITDDASAQLRRLRITIHVDLRSAQQIESTGGIREIDGIERLWAPVFKEEQYTENAAKRRYDMYAEEGTEVRDFLTSRNRLETLTEEINAKKGGSYVFDANVRRV